ncbi:MAG: FtsX-like permease family protein, partial [Clostridiales bacterium]
IVILTTGISINKQLNIDYKKASHFGATIRTNGGKDIVRILKNNNFSIEKYSNDYMQFSLYISNEKFFDNNKFMRNLLSELFNTTTNLDEKMSSETVNINIIKISEYNKLLELEGKEQIRCSNNEIIIYSLNDNNIDKCKEILRKYISKEEKINILDKNYSIHKNIASGRIITSPGQLFIFALIVPDDVIEEQIATESILNLNFLKNGKEFQENFTTELTKILNKKTTNKKDADITFSTSEIVKSIAIGYKAILTFVGIYLGLIFLITSSVILALQQLSEIVENKERYSVLNKIGISHNIINKVLLKQIAMYFFIPFFIALIHSIVGIKVIYDSVVRIGLGALF